MSVHHTQTTSASPSRALNIILWVLQILMAAFFLFVSAAPKLLGEPIAVEIFDRIGLASGFATSSV